MNGRYLSSEFKGKDETRRVTEITVGLNAISDRWPAVVWVMELQKLSVQTLTKTRPSEFVLTKNKRKKKDQRHLNKSLSLTTPPRNMIYYITSKHVLSGNNDPESFSFKSIH